MDQLWDFLIASATRYLLQTGITGRTFTAHLTTLEGIRETTGTLFRFTLYNPAMNKRARKRLKEAIEKKNLERQKMLKEQSSASSQTKERRGFTVKPEKKRG